MRFELEPLSGMVEDPSDPRFVEHLKRNRMLINNGIWVPMVGLSACQGDVMTLERTIEAAISVGYRYIDTSFSPPHEAAIGNALHRLIMTGRVKREDVFIATKLPREGNQRDMVKKYLKASIRNLQVNFVDLYLIHFPVRDVGMEDAANAGMTRSIGLCNFNPEQVNRILSIATIRPTVLQVECHPYLKQKEVVSFCRENKIAVVAYAPLASPGRPMGTLKGKKANTPPLFESPALKLISENYKKTPAQIVIRWLLQRGVIAMPRTTNFEHMRENSQVFDFMLADSDMKIIGGLSRQIRLFKFDEDRSLLDDPEYPFRSSLSVYTERRT